MPVVALDGLDALMLEIRGNILATSISFNASDASRKPDDLDDLDAAGSSYAVRKRLRALSGVFRVVVRVHSGAFENALDMGCF